ncbi:MAG: class I SAM-dependent methyltransferase [Candidatus Promineifilaceae bacterium]|nr:class I SAM-dependent methyltransferase [Candidatus Promineifilaceae bacterium]
MAESDSGPERRFSDRVDYYSRFRPHYPPEILPLLESAVGLSSETSIADVGSGTGILSRLFLDYGATVYGVEPNSEMRAAAEAWLEGYPRFTSVEGRAEDMPLPSESVELVSAGQAYHWFERSAARSEFRRILRPGGYAVLVWNDWDRTGSAFARDYGALWPIYGIKYQEVTCRVTQTEEEEDLNRFFSLAGYGKAIFSNSQHFDWKGLRGRALSSSYAPLPGHPQYQPLMIALGELFERHQKQGTVRFDYHTVLYYGRLR